MTPIKTLDDSNSFDCRKLFQSFISPCTKNWIKILIFVYFLSYNFIFKLKIYLGNYKGFFDFKVFENIFLAQQNKKKILEFIFLTIIAYVYIYIKCNKNYHYFF